jgi:hypothetical protein
MAYSKTVRRHRKRGKKGGVETRGQKRRVDEGLPAVETTMSEAPSKKATTKKAPKDPETLAESKPKTKKPTTKKERRETREKLPSVIKQKQVALEKKIAKETRDKRLEKKRRETAMKGFKLRRFKKFQESRRKKPKPKPKSKFPKTFRATKKRLSPIKESPKSSSPREYKSSADKEILAGLEKSLLGLKISK